MLAFELEDRIKLKLWEDIANRPEYQASVDVQKIRFHQVISLYAFNEQDATCGASACQKKHDRGFLVVYSSEKKETNLCQQCGEKFAGISYKDQEALLRGQDTLRQQKVRLNTLLEHSENLKNQIKELKQAPHGANWLYQSLTNFRRAYPVELLTALTSLANSTEDNNAQVEPLQGLSIFNTSIKQALIGNILKPLKELESMIKSAVPLPSLTRFCNWADKIEDHFTLAELLVAEGKLFFEATNIERLKSIPLSKKSTGLIQSIQWNCDKGVVKKKTRS